jgi:hypothetical protein
MSDTRKHISSEWPKAPARSQRRAESDRKLRQARELIADLLQDKPQPIRSR